MKVLVSLPVQHRKFDSIEDVLEGKDASSGTYGAIIRLASLLAEAGLDVCLSAACNIPSTKFPCIKHDSVDVKALDCLIVHQSHWDGSSLTFGAEVLKKTFLWLHTNLPIALAYTFLREGGRQIVCVSKYHANILRAIPNWRKGVTVIPNSYCPIFQPTPLMTSQTKPRLLFIGAVTRNKGFPELTKIWSYLAKNKVNLELAIAGSRAIHSVSENTTIGSMGVAELELETNCIQPWIKSLPEDYQPHFLGALSPIQLRDELAKSWAAIVNPSWNSFETFCVSAVDAQACERTVFSIAHGGLKETVYREHFNSLAEKRTIEAVGDRIIAGLCQKELVLENGRLAGEFVRTKFANISIRDAWVNMISGYQAEALPTQWDGIRNVVRDLMRWSGTGMLINQLRLPENRQIMASYHNLNR